MELLTFDSLTCASDEAVRLAREGAEHGSAVLAVTQRDGKGRRGHRWLGAPGSLHMAVVLRPQVPMQHLLALSAVGGMGVLDGLRALGAHDVGLGWPNDVLIARGGALVPGAEPVPPVVAKVGNLVLDAGAGEGGVFAVLGVNLNLAVAPSQAEVTEPGDFEAMHPLEPGVLADAGLDALAPELAPVLRDAVLARVDAWAAQVRAGRAAAGPLAPVLSEYFDEVPLLGQRVRATYPDGRVAAVGFLVAVDVWHRVTVRSDAGQELEFAAEQVGIRLLDRRSDSGGSAAGA